MATMYDAPMQDFSQDTTMDTDVPSASSDVDWLQVENMMDDGDDSLKPPQQEIDMNHDDLQEYEMRDVDAEYAGDFAHVTSEDPRLELQDEEIPDASRAPSPGVLAAIPSQKHSIVGPERGSDQTSQRLSGDVEAVGQSISSFQDPLAHTNDAERSANGLPNPVEKDIRLGDAGNVSVPDVQDNTTISGESTTSSQLQPQQEQKEEQSDHSDAPDISNHGQTEPYAGESHEDHGNPSQALEYHDSPEGQAYEDDDNPEGRVFKDDDNPEDQAFEDHDNLEEALEYRDNLEGQALEDHDNLDGQTFEDHDNPEVQATEDRINLGGQVIESNPEYQATEHEDEGLLIDQPPSILLFCAFDDSRFTLFNPPDISRITGDSVDAAPEESFIATNDQAEHESNPKHAISESHQTHSGIDPIGSENSILLFRERFALYYEPLSLIFEALRSESDFNVDGRFDENVELVISAPELDLTLPEDNINSREVSLHDLNVLHNGCELTGPLSLRLDTVSPRFGTRYKAIRDEIFRVVSQEEEERLSLLDPGDEYFAVLPLHDSPKNHHGDEAPLHQSRVEDERPATNTETVAGHTESSESRLRHDETIDHRPGASGPQSDEQPEYVDHSENLTLEDHVPQVQDESEAQDAVSEDVYAREAVGDEEDGEGVYEDEDALYDGTEDLEQNLNVDGFGEEQQEVYPPDDSSGFLDTHRASDAFEIPANFSDDIPPFVIEDAASSSGPPTRNDEAVTPPDAPRSTIPETLELPTSTAETASQNFGPDANASSVAEQRSRSRSRTPRQSTRGNPAHDELIAYEEAIKDAQRPQPSPPMSNRVDTHVVPNPSKRSHEELETSQPDDVDAPYDASNEVKRLRTN